MPIRHEDERYWYIKSGKGNLQLDFKLFKIEQMLTAIKRFEKELQKLSQVSGFFLKSQVLAP